MSDEPQGIPPGDHRSSDNQLRPVGPEEYRQMVSSGHLSSQKPKKSRTGWNSSILSTVLIVFVSLGVGFAGGMQYQGQRPPRTNRTGTSNGTAGQTTGVPAARRGFRRGSFGTVTNISSSAITINNQRTGSAETYQIDTNTAVSANGTSASVSDIKTGDTVLVRPDPTKANTARSIVIASSGTPGGNGPQTAPDGSSSSTI